MLMVPFCLVNTGVTVLEVPVLSGGSLKPSLAEPGRVAWLPLVCWACAVEVSCTRTDGGAGSEGKFGSGTQMPVIVKLRLAVALVGELPPMPSPQPETEMLLVDAWFGSGGTYAGVAGTVWPLTV